MTDVWITGLGVVGPHGLGIDAVLEAASAGKTAFTKWPESHAPPNASASVGAVGSFPKEKYFSERQLRQIDRVMAMSACAAGLALEDAALDVGAEGDRTATFFATSRAERTSMLRFTQPILEGKPRQLNPANFPWMARNIACGQIAVRFGLRGPSTTLASGSLAALEAVSRAYDFVRLGRVPIAVVGGAEILSKFALHMLRHDYGDDCFHSEPSFFGLRPGRLVPSEGACMLVLESAEHARARKAAPYARIDGWDAGRFGRGAWDEGLYGVWSRIPSKVGGARERIALLSVSSGGSDRAHERAETGALQRWADGVPSAARFCAPRSFAGEGECWTGLLQVALAAAALRARRVPPTWHLAEDAAEAVRARAGGGSLDGASALISGMEKNGRYSVLHLSGGVG
ncbi:MAG: hypothetical protein HKL90_03415 [Elusimicrobia bacterium]|nr:hypothetical protein [Elusimicrobiota bacterium]